MPSCSVRTFPFPLRAMLCLPCLFTPPVGFLCIFTYFLTCSCMSLACQCVIQSKPTFVPHGQHLLFAFLLVCLLPCLLVCLFAFLIPHLFVYLVACHVSCHMLCLPYLSCLFTLYHLCITYASLSFHCLSASFLSLPLHVHIQSEDAWSQGSISQAQAKRRGCEHVDISQKAMFSSFRGLGSPIWLCTLSDPLTSSLFSLLDGLHQVYHVVYCSSSSLEYGNPCLLSCTYILGHALGMQAFTFLLCVLALCMMYVYIYLLAPFRYNFHSPYHLRQSNA